MRWSIIRLIWLRELRDQLRDRRTLLMIAGLPLFLYPVLGFVVLHLARGFTERPSTIGVVTASPEEHEFPPRHPVHAGRSALPPLAWLTALPRCNGAGTECWQVCALQLASQEILDYPFLVQAGHWTPRDDRWPAREGTLSLLQARLRLVFLDTLDGADLDENRVDLILSTPVNFFALLEAGENPHCIGRPALQVRGRPDDDHSRLALRRLTPLLETWKAEMKQVRLARCGLPPQFDDPFDVREPQNAATSAPALGVVDMVIRIFPFMLVMWSLAGALYPAVDLCAGEKERGTMETLLITPAGREEIVLGKFLTIWVFSAGTSLLNLLSMGITTWHFGSLLPQGSLPLGALFWCVVLSLPQAALFSAISLSIGAYARSTKEGQYYLMPLFIISMPLMFLTLAPGVVLNPFYSLVPITGVALLMQRLMTATSLEQVPWLYFLPVLAPIAIYSWLALRWAIVQFHREEVLFREAERIDVRLWLRHLLRDKEPLPTTGQAFFCFGLILLLRWLALGLGEQMPLEVHTGIGLLAFVAAPALFMAVLLNTRPRDALALRGPSIREMALAAVLAVLLLPPITGLTQAVTWWFPNLLENRHPLVEILRALTSGQELSRGQLASYMCAFALLPAVCEELAFRGYLLSGLRRRFRPRSAVLVSAFLFALYYMNAFLFVPAFFLGVALGLLTLRSKSLLPAVALHFLHNSVLIAGIPLGRLSDVYLPEPWRPLWPWLVGSCLSLALALLWWLYRKPYVDLERSLRCAAVAPLTCPTPTEQSVQRRRSK
jgi:sodium transport system permease protein